MAYIADSIPCFCKVNKEVTYEFLLFIPDLSCTKIHN